MFGRMEVMTETVEREATSLIAEVNLATFANIVWLAVSDDTKLAWVDGLLAIKGFGIE